MSDEIAAPASPETTGTAETAAPQETAAPVASSAPESATTTLRKAFEEAQKKNPNWKPAGDQPRAPDGKFATKTVDEKPADARPAAEAPTEAPVGEKPAEKPVEKPLEKKPAVQVPGFLSSSEKAALAKLAPQEQAALINRMRQIQGASDKARIAYEKQVADFGEVGKVLAERKDAWARNGLLPGQAVAQLIAYSDWATKDPVGFITKLAESRGIDLGALVDQMRTPVDPQTRALQHELQRTQAEQAALRNYLAQEQQRQLETKVSTARSTIDKFATATDQRGVPLRPHWGVVEGEVTQIVNAWRARNPDAPPFGEAELHRAYQAAVAAHPELSEQVIQSQVEARMAKARQEAEAKAKAARSASASIPSQSLPSTRVVNIPKSGADHLRMLMRERGMTV